MNLLIRKTFLSLLFIYTFNFAFSQQDASTNSLPVVLKEKNGSVTLKIQIIDGVDTYRLNQRIERWNSQLNAGITCKVKQGKFVTLSYQSQNVDHTTRDKLLKSIATIHHFDSFTIQM